MKVVFLEYFIVEWNTLLVEFKVALNKFQKEEIVVAHKWWQSRFGFECCLFWMSLISDLFTQVHDDLIKGFEMIDVFSNHLLRSRVCFSPHQSIQSFLIICDNFPSSTNRGKYFRQILYPAIKITIFKCKLMILSSVGLQPDSHLSILFNQQSRLELLILHWCWILI